MKMNVAIAIACGQAILAEYLIKETPEMQDLISALNKGNDPFQEEAVTLTTSLEPADLSNASLPGGKAEEKTDEENKKNNMTESNKESSVLTSIKNTAKDIKDSLVPGADKAKQEENANKSKFESEKSQAASAGQLPIAGMAAPQAKDSKSAKLPTSFWTNVNINNTIRRVKVSVKTVAVIDSVAASKGNNEDKKKENAKKSKDPYIKVQMPGQKKDKATSKPPASSISSVASSVSSSAKPSNKQKPTSSTKESAPSSAKPASKSQSKNAAPKTDNKKASANTHDADFNTIIEILKNMPKGRGGDNNSYVEGKFSFPKISQLKNREFKLSGYLSS